MHAGIPPPLPRAGAPSQSRHPPSGAGNPPGSRHPLWEQAAPLGRHPPEQAPPGADIPPPSRRLLLWTVRILLECILVILFFLLSPVKFI